MYSPAKDARISEAMSELATFNAAHDARKDYNDELRRSQMLEYEAFRNTGSMMDMLDEAGITKTPRSLIDEVISPAMQSQHTQKLNTQQTMSDWTERQKKNYGPRARTRRTPFSRNKWKRENIRTRRRAEKKRQDTFKSRNDGERMDAEEEADEGVDDDDDDDNIVDDDDVVVDGEIPPTHILKKLLKTINEHKEDDEDDDHVIEINGASPVPRLHVKLQTVLETSTGAGRGRHKSRRHHKKKKKSRRPRKHKNKSTRRRKPKKTKRR